MAAPVELPDDMIYCEILPRLPYRALMRLSAVCKAWRHTICHDDAFATAQARTPSSASVGIARCVRGSQLKILRPWAKDVVPRDPFFSLVEVDRARLSFCACTGGVVLLMEHPDPRDEKHWQHWLGRDREQWRRYVSNFYVVNPNLTRTHGIRRVSYDYAAEVVTAGLAYDPASEGFQIVVPADEDVGLCKFRRFSSRRGEWSLSRKALAVPPLEQFKPKPVYADRRMHWLAGNVVVWYDPDGDHAGTTPLLLAAGSWSFKVLELGEHEKIGPLVVYHSSMAKLPDITTVTSLHELGVRKSFW
jgi:hypothetical protein